MTLCPHGTDPAAMLCPHCGRARLGPDNIYPAILRHDVQDWKARALAAESSSAAAERAAVVRMLEAWAEQDRARRAAGGPPLPHETPAWVLTRAWQAIARGDHDHLKPEAAAQERWAAAGFPQDPHAARGEVQPCQCAAVGLTCPKCQPDLKPEHTP